MHVEDEIANILAKKHGHVRSVNIWYRYRMGRIFQCTRQKIESVRVVFIALITALVWRQISGFITGSVSAIDGKLLISDRR